MHQHLLTVLLAAAGVAVHAAPGADGAHAAVPAALNAAQRDAVAADLVARWRSQVQGLPASDARAWAEKLGRAARTAQPSSLLLASTMPTLDAMHLALVGGQPTFAAGGPAPTVLGSTVADLVYTPLPEGRCRIANSRTISLPLAPGVTRAIDVEDVVSYAGQGGTGTYAGGDGSFACGIPSFTRALALSVRVFDSPGTGIFKVFENGLPYQAGNTITLNAGQNASADLIVNSCQTCTNELAVYSEQPVHYTIDVIGYFMPPQATALSCVYTSDTSFNVLANGGTATIGAPACPTGYTETATNCSSNGWLVPFTTASKGTCAARNNGGVNATIRASRTCCRVPGR